MLWACYYKGCFLLQNLFSSYIFFCFQAFETKKGPANLVQGQDGHVRF